MNLNKKFYVGIVGAGHIANLFHIPAWKNNKSIKQISICDPDKSKIKKTLKKFKLKFFFSNINSMLKNKEIDIINICSPPYLHFKHILSAIKFKKHIFCEKPFVLNYNEFKKLIKKIKKNKIICTCAYHQRFRPVSIKFKEMIDSNIIGEIYYINIVKRQLRSIPSQSKVFSNKKFSGGGPLIDLGSHYFDLVCWFLNFPKIKNFFNTNIYKLSNPNLKFIKIPFGKFNNEELSVGQIYSKNCIINYELGYVLNADKEKNSIEIFGTKGSLIWPHGKIITFKNNKKVQRKIKTYGKLASQNQIDQFIKNILIKSKPLVSLNQIGYIINLIEKLYKKTETIK